MLFPKTRLRRLRKTGSLRTLIRQTRLSVEDLIMPVFVVPGKNIKKPIRSMPGIYQFSIDNVVREIKELKNLGISAILLFGIPEKKDELGTSAYAQDGIIQNTVKAIKDKFDDIFVITDVCLCEYTNHGHCGVVKDGRRTTDDGRQNFYVDNDATLELLAKTAISQIKAGADMVAPSAMMDGQVFAIRAGLDEEGYEDIPIMSYSAKYASSFYGPFREAADSPPRFGDRKSYQLDFANSNEALREIALDLEEGADIIMVKPALAYLDIINKAKEKFLAPLAAYNVSGEYSMIKAGGKLGCIDSEKVMVEALTSIKRAGADFIISYFAKEFAQMSTE